nr:MAG: hypothetical protein [Lake Baikal virophage 9]
MSEYYLFEYFIKGKKHFEGTLLRERCIAIDENNRRCRKYVSIGRPYCSIHRVSEMKLDIRPSTIKQAGNGLFACDPTKSKNAIIFKKGKPICEYIGDRISFAKNDKRYDDQSVKPPIIYTAPYSINADNKYQLDSSLNRGIASLSNEKSEEKSNAQLQDYPFPPEKGVQAKVYLEAIKNIRNNQEIFCWYGNDYSLKEPTSYVTKPISKQEYLKFGAHKCKYYKKGKVIKNP